LVGAADAQLMLLVGTPLVMAGSPVWLPATLSVGLCQFPDKDWNVICAAEAFTAKAKMMMSGSSV